MSFKWQCPYCNRHTTIVGSSFHTDYTNLEIDNADGYKRLTSQFIICPNPDCNKFTLTVFLLDRHYNRNKGEWEHKLTKQWRLVPESDAKVFPDYIPEAILADYLEACLIKNLSPKASATLSRRCLQGIIRDFWGVKKSKLIDEIKAIEDKVDPLVWRSIDGVRKIGNIGAHMEEDINLIIEVEPEEANKLIELIELLLTEWYVSRHQREQKLNEIVGISEEKDKKKKAADKK